LIDKFKNDIFHRQLAKKIKKLREEKKWSIGIMSDKSHLTMSDIRASEINFPWKGLKHAVLISNAFKIRFCDLIQDFDCEKNIISQRIIKHRIGRRWSKKCLAMRSFLDIKDILQAERNFLIGGIRRGAQIAAAHDMDIYELIFNIDLGYFYD
jgi:hypothetical protein